MHPENSRPEPLPGGASRTALPLLPLDLVAWLRTRRPTPALPDQTGSHPAKTPAGPLRHDDRSTTLPRRIATYLSRIPPAVSGERGHDRTFHVACVLVKGFGLSIDEARPFLLEWNQRCLPPWGPKELEHKLRSADKTADDRARGYLRSDRKPPPAGRPPSLPAGGRAARPRGPGRWRRLPGGPGDQPAPPGPSLPGRPLHVSGRDRTAVLARSVLFMGWMCLPHASHE